MRMCSNCEKCLDKCKISNNSVRCVECIQKGAVDCNLAPFSPAKQTRIQRQRNKKAAKAKKAIVAFKESLAQYNQLQQEVDVLERKGLAIVEDKIAYIDKLEELENSSGGLRPNIFCLTLVLKNQCQKITLTSYL